MKKVRKIVLSGLLLAAAIVINRFLSINTSILSIGFTFVPLIFAGIILGPKYSTIIAGLTDLIGALLFPTGPYFIGFTISSLLTGLIYGIFLYDKELKVDKKFIIKLLLTIIVICVLINGCLNSMWIIIMYKKTSYAIIPTRIVKELIMIPVEFITTLGLSKLLNKQINEVKND